MFYIFIVQDNILRVIKCRCILSGQSRYVIVELLSQKYAPVATFVNHGLYISKCLSIQVELQNGSCDFFFMAISRSRSRANVKH